jgi:type I restriction enzyme S subunit
MQQTDDGEFAALTKHLEISVVPMRKVLAATPTRRLDPEYFQRVHMADADTVKRDGDRFTSLSSLGIVVDASAFYPSIEGYYGQGDLPFLRVADVDGFVDVDQCLTIPADLCSRYPTLLRVAAGDILFTKGGAIDRVGLATRGAAISRDLIVLKTSPLGADWYRFLFAYFSSTFFRRALLRSSSQTAQPHLTITLVRDLPVMRSTPTLRSLVARIVADALSSKEEMNRWLREADRQLVDAVGLLGWVPSDPLTYLATKWSVLAAGRLDPGFFAPQYADLVRHIEDTGRSKRFDDVLTLNVRGNQPQYTSSPGLPVVNSKHVRTNRIHPANMRFGDPSKSNVLIQYGDLLMNGTGVGTIGRAAPYLATTEAIPDNHVTVLRVNDLDPVFLAVYLNSRLGQLQVQQYLKGSSGQIELYPSDIGQFRIWNGPEDVQTSIRSAVESAFAAERQASSLLTTAIRAVELAIVSGEVDALRLIEQSGA